MNAIYTEAIVAPDGQINLKNNLKVNPGSYKVIMLSKEKRKELKSTDSLDLKMIEQKAWSKDSNYRREEIYED